MSAYETAQLALELQFFTLAIVGLVFTLIFWQKSLFLYMLGVPVGIVYGLSLAVTYTTTLSLWVIGVVIAIIGTYFLFKVVELVLAGARSKRE
jgi:hypothetical protein